MLTEYAVDRVAALHAARQRCGHARRLIARTKNAVRRSQGQLLVALILIEQIRSAKGRNNPRLQGEKPA